MRFKGNVTEISNSIAKVHVDKVETKQKFTMNLSSPMVSNSYSGYGYGSLNFTMHQTESKELGIELGKKYSLVIIPTDQEYSGKSEDDLKFEIAELRNKFDSLTMQHSQTKDLASARDSIISDLKNTMSVLRLENVRLLNENMSLRTIYQPKSNLSMLDSNNTVLLSDTPSYTK